MTAYEEALARDPKPDAPFKDNPSGMYCRDCRLTGMAHCSDPEHCGGMERMRDLETPTKTPDKNVAVCIGCGWQTCRCSPCPTCGMHFIYTHQIPAPTYTLIDLDRHCPCGAKWKESNHASVKDKTNEAT
jgi:hypothetical protein